MAYDDVCKARGRHELYLHNGTWLVCAQCGYTQDAEVAKTTVDLQLLAPSTHKAEALQDADRVVMEINLNVYENLDKRPNMNTLLEEMAEAILANRGKHEHPLRLELVQIAGICVNMIRQIDAGEPFKP